MALSKHASHSPSAYTLALTALFAAFFGLGSSVEARQDPALMCDQVAQIAAQQTGVPVSVLLAITRTETGQKRDGHFSPWPWTVNMEGKGVWFDTLDEARAYVFKNFKRGARSFDVGCFQINYKWHHKAFSSIDEMFEPLANATYAANFLKDLYDEHGNWSDAAGAYHSRTPEFANRYKAAFEKHRTRVAGLSPMKATKTALVDTHVTRVNSYPLLQVQSEASRLGSLVPLSQERTTNSFLELSHSRKAQLK